MSQAIEVNNVTIPIASVRELLVGESIEVRAIDIPLDATTPLASVSVPDGATITVTGATASGFSVAGLYRFTVLFANGRPRTLDVFVFDTATTAHIAAHSSPSAAPVRLIQRALAQNAAARGAGTLAAIKPLNLIPYGA